MKKLLTLLAIALFAGTSFAGEPKTTATDENTTISSEDAVAVTLRYYNKDSKSHTFKVKMSGSTKEVKFDASKTSSVTIQGGSDDCVIICDCGEVKVKGGDHITIKNGCITVD